MKKAGELGLLSVAVPEAYGGMGMGFIDTMLVCDYISGATGSFSTAFGAHTGIGTLPIVLFGGVVRSLLPYRTRGRLGCELGENQGSAD